MMTRIGIVVILTLVGLILLFLVRRGKLPKRLIAIGATTLLVMGFVSNVLQPLDFIWSGMQSSQENLDATVKVIPTSSAFPKPTPIVKTSAVQPQPTESTVFFTTPSFELNQSASDAVGSVHQVAWSPDNSMLAVALFRDAIVKMYSSNLDLLRQCKGHTEGVRSVSFSLDGAVLASGGSDATVRVWTWQSTTCIQKFVLAHSQPVLSVVFHPQKANLLATAADDGFIQLWDVSKGKNIGKWRADKQAVASLAFSADGQFLLSGGSDSVIHIWTLTGQEVGQMVGHTGWIWDLAFDSSGEFLASAGTGDLYNQNIQADNTARIWSWRDRKELYALPSGSHYVMTVAFCINSKFLLSGSRYVTSPDRNSLRIWRTDNGALSMELSGLNEAITSMRISPDGKQLAVGTSSSVPWGSYNIGNLMVFQLPEMCEAN